MRMLTAYSTLGVSSPVGYCTCICTALQVDALVRTEELRSLAPPEAGRLYQLGSDDNDPVAKQCQVVESKA